MTRESSVVQMLVELADTLVEDFDVVELLTGLADRCVKLLGVSAAGVMLASPDGELRLMASSNEAMRILELFELQADEGPCLDAFHTGPAHRTREPARGSGRWPRFSAAALEAGFGSVFALPLRVRHATIGALNLFRSPEEAPMADADVVMVRRCSPTWPPSPSSSAGPVLGTDPRPNEQLTGALESRVVIEQAKGVIAERAGVDLAEAFSRLRRYARNHNLRLTDVAQASIDGTLDPLAWTTTHPSQPTLTPPRIHRD